MWVHSEQSCFGYLKRTMILIWKWFRMCEVTRMLVSKCWFGPIEFAMLLKFGSMTMTILLLGIWPLMNRNGTRFSTFYYYWSHSHFGQTFIPSIMATLSTLPGVYMNPCSIILKVSIWSYYEKSFCRNDHYYLWLMQYSKHCESTICKQKVLVE